MVGNIILDIAALTAATAVGVVVHIARSVK